MLPLLGMVSLLAACGPTHVYIQSDTPAPAPAPPPEPAPPPAITYQTFYDALSPYGQWTDYPNVGYVWIPNAGPDFKPYSSDGRWVYSDQGWTWVSDYSWGWAPFHYGRWFFDDNYGWCWVPGYEWAPAWVSWRTSPDYYGWAPLGPTVGVSVSIASYNPPPQTWCFVPRQYVASPHINTYAVNQTNNVTIINRTTVINNYTVINNRVTNNTTINNTTINNNTRNVYVAGPPRAEVEAATRTTIRPVTFRETATPGATQVNNNQVTMYRPPVRTAPANQGATTPPPAPARVSPFRGNPSGNAGSPNGQPNGGQPGRYQGQPNQGQPSQPNSGQPNGGQPGRYQGQSNNGQPNNGQPGRYQGQPAQTTPVQNQGQTQPPRMQGIPNRPVTQQQPAQPTQRQPTQPQPAQPQQQPNYRRPVQPNTQGNPQGNAQTPGTRQQPPRTAPGQGDNQGRFKPGGHNGRQVMDTTKGRGRGN
jgi:hypothetical protein